MKKVELLAPAGNFESFLGAVHAGADAVYIGGRKYGARAYAENFTEEEVCLAIRYAHIFGRKLYLTVNTLVKEEEMAELPEYIRPFYEEGLDGVIVQDMGVFSLLKECFPDLELHGSTQMTITGARGAKFLLEQGVSRVVPARELSLAEIGRIKETGIEVEAFIHGAMCYCYSGQCLFSSMLGGRSGNRGRCAQPCRLPYEITEIESGAGSGYDMFRKSDKRKRKSYPLSLKDMCTLTLIPDLIEAGIDSFKIEGRMKKPEYAAGVTAIYRKYIDRYYAAPQQKFTVLPEDLERLRSLYIRSEIQEGYYYRHNGREMITPDQPGYAGTDEACLKEIRSIYLEHAPKIPVSGEIILKKNEPAVLILQTADGQGDSQTINRRRICLKGQTVQAAQKQPLTKEAVEKQLNKTGKTPFIFETLTVDLESDVFLPVKALNDLRRDGAAKLEEAMLEPYRRDRWVDRRENSGSATEKAATDECKGEIPYVAVQLQQTDQLRAVCGMEGVDRLYVDGDLAIQEPLTEKQAAEAEDTADREETDKMLAAWKAKRKDRSLFFVMPCIIRLRDERYLEMLEPLLFSADTLWDGVMVRNLESLYWLKEKGYGKGIVGDANLYTWNRQAKAFFEKMGVCVSAPLECSKEDLHKLGIQGMEVIVYGSSTLMVTANCIRKTGMQCPKEMHSGDVMRYPAERNLVLHDRYGADFPVRTVCRHCYNEIYNSVPLSLHEYGKSVTGGHPSGIRLVFTTEQPEEVYQVFACYKGYTAEPGRQRKAEFSYTRGHYKRGAE